MIFRLKLGRWRFTFSMAPVAVVRGVNSKLPDGGHILMWDFDDCHLSLVQTALEEQQIWYQLPNIHILNSGRPNHYIAYCFKRHPWIKAVEIVVSTRGVCWNYVKWSVLRGYFTLRITPKEGHKVRPVKLLTSPIPENVKVADLYSFEEYETIANEKFAAYSSIDITRKGVEYKRPATLKQQ